MKILKIFLGFVFYWGLVVLLIHGLILSFNQTYNADNPQPVFGQIITMIGCVAFTLKPLEYFGNEKI